MLRLFKDKTKLKLTGMDDAIYAHFRSLFPSLSVALLEEGTLKEEKSKWQVFCNHYQFETAVNDYNFATMLRLNARGDYNESNTTIVPRIQFHAIEIARNRECDNDYIVFDEQEE